MMLRMLDCLERAADAIRTGCPVPDADVVRILMLMNVLVYRGHYAKERCLFQRLRDRGPVPVEGLQDEHRDSIDFATAMLKSLPDAVRGEPSARRMLAENATASVGFMRAHIAREEKLVFALADAVLAEADCTELASVYDRIDVATGGPLSKAMAGDIERSLAGTLGA